MAKDHCTMWFENWFGTYIGDCCRKHDDAYDEQTESKEEGDEDLFDCIMKKVPLKKGNFICASLMWFGVRAGGLVSWNNVKNESS